MKIAHTIRIIACLLIVIWEGASIHAMMPSQGVAQPASDEQTLATKPNERKRPREEITPEKQELEEGELAALAGNLSAEESSAKKARTQERVSSRASSASSAGASRPYSSLSEKTSLPSKPAKIIDLRGIKRTREQLEQHPTSGATTTRTPSPLSDESGPSATGPYQMAVQAAQHQRKKQDAIEKSPGAYYFKYYSGLITKEDLEILHRTGQPYNKRLKSAPQEELSPEPELPTSFSQWPRQTNWPAVIQLIKTSAATPGSTQIEFNVVLDGKSAHYHLYKAPQKRPAMLDSREQSSFAENWLKKPHFSHYVNRWLTNSQDALDMYYINPQLGGESKIKTAVTAAGKINLRYNNFQDLLDHEVLYHAFPPVADGYLYDNGKIGIDNRIWITMQGDIVFRGKRIPGVYAYVLDEERSDPKHRWTCTHRMFEPKPNTFNAVIQYQ